MSKSHSLAETKSSCRLQVDSTPDALFREGASTLTARNELNRQCLGGPRSLVVRNESDETLSKTCIVGSGMTVHTVL